MAKHSTTRPSQQGAAERLRAKLRRQALGVVALYAAAAGGWVVASDHLAAALIEDPALLARVGTYKGSAFVVATAILLALLLRRTLRTVDRVVAMLLRDVATRKKAEEAAERERAFAAHVVEAMPGIVYLYEETGRFLRWNENFGIVSGYSDEEIARMHPLDFFAADDKALLGASIGAVFESGASSVEAEFLSKDGTRTPYFFTGRRLQLDGTTCLVGMGIDIGERKKAERELLELNESLERKVQERTVALADAKVRAEAADRIKSAFLATMSHELRTPLNSILGFSGMLVQGLAGPLNPEQAKQLGMVQSSARHLLELINDVLDISKIEAGQLEIRRAAFDLGASVEKVVASLQPLAHKRGLALRVDLSGAPSSLTSDRRRVEQILLNLLNNALKFTERGSVTLAVSATASSTRLQVVDSGIGMRPEDLSRLFQPFHQLDNGLQRRHEGTGLGLAITHRLTELLGGTIHVDSEWGQGSVFTVELPGASEVS